MQLATKKTKSKTSIRDVWNRLFHAMHQNQSNSTSLIQYEFGIRWPQPHVVIHDSWKFALNNNEIAGGWMVEFGKEKKSHTLKWGMANGCRVTTDHTFVCSFRKQQWEKKISGCFRTYAVHHKIGPVQSGSGQIRLFAAESTAVLTRIEKITNATETPRMIVLSCSNHVRSMMTSSWLAQCDAFSMWTHLNDNSRVFRIHFYF